MTLEEQAKAQQIQIENLFSVVKDLRDMLGEQHAFRNTCFFMMDIKIKEIQESIEDTK